MEEVLAYVDRVGGETLIIEFDVLDVDRTADDMLILLQRRGMSVVGATEASPTSPLTAEESLVALYVEAPESQLAAVMDDLLLQVDITEGAAFNEEAAGPLMKDRLQQFEQRSITFDRRDNARSAEPVPILSAASPVPDQPSALPPQAPSPPRMAARATSQMKMADAQEPEETPGQAVRLSLPAGVYQQMETRVESPEQAQSRRMMPSRAAPFSAAAPAAPPAEEDAEGDSFQRVLFVLQRDAAR